MKKQFALRGECDFCLETTEVHSVDEYGQWICNDCEGTNLDEQTKPRPY